MIVIQPLGGLCNRIRAINSARCLAKLRNDKLVVLWNVNNELGIKYEQLFEKTNEYSVINYYSNISIIKSILQSICNIKKSFYSNSKILKYKYQGIYKEEQLIADIPKGMVYIQSGEEYIRNRDYSIFKPISDIEMEIDSITNEWNGNCVGVHIRRTDHKGAINNSPLECFMKRMDECVEACKDVKFFLATDDIEVEKVLKKKYSKRIVTNPNRVLSRKNSRGMINAVIDLYCLSKTKKMLGSSYSSFSELASYIGNIELEVVKK